MAEKPANLHQLTVAQAAKLMNVSERSVYMARELAATGRDDLVRAIKAGEMSLLAALRIAKPERYAKQPNRVNAMQRLWCAMTAEEHLAFMDWVLAENDVTTD